LHSHGQSIVRDAHWHNQARHPQQVPRCRR
jgi:hypothetical protein